MKVNRTLQDLDFYKILSFIKDYSHSEATVKTIQSFYPCEKIEDAKILLEEFSEIREFFDKGNQFPISFFPDITNLIEKAKKEGVFFEPSELAEFLKVLKLVEKTIIFIDELKKYKVINKRIKEFLGEFVFSDISFLLRKLDLTVDEEGNLLDSASQMLKYLRKQIKITEERIKIKLEEIISRPDVEVFLQDRFITKRNNRWVIPVRMDSKGQIKGILHDISRSGETAFIEPEEITAFSKRVEELKVEERVEEIRILKELSYSIFKESEKIERYFNLLVYFDRLNAIYKFAQRFKANVPELTEKRYYRLVDARHPILLLSKESVVPLNLELSDKKVLLITGPNAGGKTVALKTIGLLTAMALSGLPIPANPSTVIPFFNSIYVDLYHEGSIEEHLSSFTSHLMKIKEIIDKADSQSLILLDEIGTNTDPEEGSALACAILDELSSIGALTVATTHLSKVKIFAATQETMEVASMLFDEKTMTPLYKLEKGVIAPSYALYVAKKYGFPERILKKAYELKGTEDTRIYEIVKELELVKSEYETKLKELEELKHQILKDRERIRNEIMKIEEKRKKTIEQAKEEAQQFISKMKKEISRLYEEAKKADKQRLKEISKKLYELSSEFYKKENKLSEIIKVGDYVKVGSLNLSGRVLSIEGSKVKIQTDKLQIEADLDELEKIHKDIKTEESFRFEKSEEFEKVDIKVDVRGLRVDEAVSKLERFINDILLADLSVGIIIHGVGKGVLRDAIRDYLKEHPLVKSFRKGDHEEGGDGVTIFELR
ncbi:MAG: endonuclease MutS2 [Thermodesulfovibrio sp.]|nr:endonuclease MutS2 [Thermodesulfovibrio sp.]